MTGIEEFIHSPIEDADECIVHLIDNTIHKLKKAKEIIGIY